MILPLPPDAPAGLFDEVQRVLQQSGVVAVPTESFYALAANPFDGRAVRRILEMKGRPETQPLPLMIADRAPLDALVAGVSAPAALLIDAFWPGPLTLTFRASSLLAEGVACGTGTVGVRQSPFAPLGPLLRRVGPLTATSANRSGEPAADTAAAVEAIFGQALDLILDGGQTKGGRPSTVVETVGCLRLIREGPISREQLEAVLHPAGFTLEP
jgi:L-threonylcarbamoyladenylate synthase